MDDGIAAVTALWSVLFCPAGPRRRMRKMRKMTCSASIKYLFIGGSKPFLQLALVSAVRSLGFPRVPVNTQRARA